MTSTGKALTAGGCVLVAILCFGAFAQKGLDREGPEPTETVETVEFMPLPDFPDCDQDDRSPHWEVSDCGPSPLPKVSPRPVKTAFQPKPTAAPKSTRRR